MIDEFYSTDFELITNKVKDPVESQPTKKQFV